MIELNDFYNAGFGWICRQCEDEFRRAGTKEPARPNVFAEGEAEDKAADLSGRALARWTDKTRRFLTCPRCGITEPVERS